MNSFFNKICSVNGLIPKIVEFDAKVPAPAVLLGKEFVDTIVSSSLLLVVVHHDWWNLVRTYGGHDH